MRPKTLARKYLRRREDAVAAVLVGKSLCEAAELYHIPHSTIHIHILRSRERAKDSKPPSLPAGRRETFTCEEKAVVVDLLRRYADNCLLLKRLHIVEAFQTIIETFSAVRKAALPFLDGLPGVRFVRNFVKRNKDRLCFSRPMWQEAIRYAEKNTEALTTPFANLSRALRSFRVAAKEQKEFYRKQMGSWQTRVRFANM